MERTGQRSGGDLKHRAEAAAPRPGESGSGPNPTTLRACGRRRNSLPTALRVVDDAPVAADQIVPPRRRSFFSVATSTSGVVALRSATPPRAGALCSVEHYHASIESLPNPSARPPVPPLRLLPDRRIQRRSSTLMQQLRAKEMAETSSSRRVSQKDLGKGRSPAPGVGMRGEMSQKQREKVDAGSIPQNHNAKKNMCPPDLLRRGIHGPVSMTEARVAGEKKQHTRGNTSFPTKRTTAQLKTRTSSRCSNTSTNRPDPRDGGNTAAAQEQRQSAANKTAKDMEAIIQKLNELGLGEDISFEEHYGYLMQLPKYTYIDTKIDLSIIDGHYMEIRHAVYRIRSFKLSQNVSKYELCCDELIDCPMDLLDKEEFPSDFLVDMDFFKFFQQEGVLDWYFHPELCKIAGLDDYQRLVPRNHWKHDAYEYANWEGYMGDFHTYEMEHEYIEYFETLLSELKWLENCLPIRRTSSAIADKICTRGIYQATKIATRFSKMTSHLAFFGFYECFTYMSIEATWCDGSDDLFFEIWKRVAQEKESLRDAVKEVYKLNKFLSRQDFMKYAVEEDDLIILEKGFQTCMRGVTKDVSEDEARELIAEAVKKQRIKPKFYHEYIKKKMDIARSIGLIPTVYCPNLVDDCAQFDIFILHNQGLFAS
ncbi:hypothetical protein ACQ4PT_035628 [Festuca glaucescens]